MGVLIRGLSEAWERKRDKEIERGVWPTLLADRQIEKGMSVSGESLSPSTVCVRIFKAWNHYVFRFISARSLGRGGVEGSCIHQEPSVHT